MIVDDMEIIRKEIKKYSIWGEETGFIVVSEAKDGQDALNKLRNKKVDLVITDIKMPVVDGVELLKRIIHEKLSSCVVFLSEYGEFEYARQGIVYGAFDYIVKPIDEEKLKDLLQKAAQYINEKNYEKEKIEKLEVELEEKIEILYTHEDIKKIIKLFKDVDLKVIEAASNLIETIGTAINYDAIKIAYTAKHIMSAIISALEEIYPWLCKFVDVSEYTSTDFTKASSFSDIRNTFLEIIRELIMTIKKFEFGNETNSMIRNICKVVLDRTDTEVSVRTIADQLFLNQSYLSTVYKEKTGITLVEYMIMVKMERAKVLLHNSNIKNYEVADILGYKDAEYFSKVFKKYTGKTPSEYKRTVLNT